MRCGWTSEGGASILSRSLERVIVCIGTRPEAIKMAPVIAALRERQSLDVVVMASGQHDELLQDAMRPLGLDPDSNLGMMVAGQAVSRLLSSSIEAIDRALRPSTPSLVVVHGDTTTTLAATLAAFHLQIPVAHVEAGLRSHDLKSPWPEEGNRKLVDDLASLHFAPTKRAVENLQSEGHDASIFLTGNTVIDTLRQTLGALVKLKDLEEMVERIVGFDPRQPYVLVTQHRRENFGEPMARVLTALQQLADDGHRIVLVAHPNSAAQAALTSLRITNDNLQVIRPQPYDLFIALMRYAALVVTDSGGLQEEAPSLGLHVLVTRSTTERQEAVDAGAAVLVGTSTNAIISVATEILTSDSSRTAPVEDLQPSPYGDGLASLRIAAVIERFLLHGSL